MTGSTTIQLITIILPPMVLTLAVASLFRPENSIRWLDHITLFLLALWTILLINILGLSTIQGFLRWYDAMFAPNSILIIPGSAAHTIILGIIIVLGVSAFVALTRMTKPFSAIDSFSIFLLALPLLALQYTFGSSAMEALNSMQEVAHKNISNFNITFLIFTAIIAFRLLEWLAVTVLRLPRYPVTGQRLQKLALPLLSLSTFCLQQFVNTHTSLLPSANVLESKVLLIQPLSLLNENIALNTGIALLVLSIVYGWFMHGKRLFLNHLSLIGIGLLCLIVETLQRPHTAYISEVEQFLFSWVGFGVKYFPILIAFSALLRPLRFFGGEWLFDIFDNLTSIARRLFLCLCVGFTILILSNHIERSAMMNLSWTLLSDRYAALFFIFIILIVVRGSMLFIQGLQTRYRARQPLPAGFDRWSCTFMLLVVITLVVIWNGLTPLGKLLLMPPPTTAWEELPIGSLPITTGIMALLVTAIISLRWMQASLATSTRHTLGMLLAGAILCLGFALVAMMWTTFQMMVLSTTLLGLLLLTASIFLAALTIP